MVSIIEVVLIVILIFHVFYSIKHYNDITSDMIRNDYVVYQGEIFHDNYQKDSFYHNVYIRSESSNKKILLRFPDYANHHNSYLDFSPMPDGKFSGTVTYSAKSKIIVAWNNLS